MKEVTISYEHLTSEQKAYWAGLLDGEGCLMFQKNSKTGYRYPSVTLAMTCEKTLKEFQRVFDTGSVTTRSREAMKEHWKDCYVAKVTTHKAAKLCEALLPYFITKSEIAKELATFYIKTCTICDKEFWGFQHRDTCSDNCYKEYKRRRAYAYR